MISSAETTILLVDDNPDDISIMRRLLTQYQTEHFKVISATNVLNGLEMLASDSADLLMLDYSLPAEDGITFLRRASGLVDLPPVIIVTGQTDHRLAAEAIRWGAVDFLYKHAMTSQTLGVAVQQALVRFRREEQLSKFDENVIYAFVATISGLETTGGQSVAMLAEILGRELGLNEHQLTLLRYGSLLHDVGKLGVRNDVILKPGPLTDDEFEEVRSHPLIGERLCGSLRLARELGPIIRHHHERWDGTGYVDGLAGENIPLLARVVSVVDAYDAMTQTRPYRLALSRFEAIRRLRAGAGTQWDPRIVSTFVGVITRMAPDLSNAA